MKKERIKRGVLLLLLVALIGAIPKYERILPTVASIAQEDVLLIDAGHGGFDGGAQSSQGLSEKDINLAIAKELKQLAKAQGWLVVMTRETDIELGGKYKGSIRSRKVRDLKARADLIEQWKPTVAVSIHLNSFRQDASVQGAQVFYPGSGGSKDNLQRGKKLAKIIQEKIKKNLKDDTNRPALAKQNSYLFKSVHCPMALIECGFLSNPQEAEKLKNVKYQQKIAKTIFDGIMHFSSKTPEKKEGGMENRRDSRQ